MTQEIRISGAHGSALTFSNLRVEAPNNTTIVRPKAGLVGRLLRMEGRTERPRNARMDPQSLLIMRARTERAKLGTASVKSTTSEMLARAMAVKADFTSILARYTPLRA